jgi:RND family efflux transporter MFP subunit
MAKVASPSRKWLTVLSQILMGLVFAAVVVVLMIWLAGGFKPKISASAVGETAEPAYTGPTATVRRIALPQTEEAVGTVKPVYEMVVSPRVAARITELNLVAGQQVSKGDVLVRLDDHDLKARLEQTKASATAAAAARNQAKIDLKQVEEVRAHGAASKLEYDRADLALKTTEAEVQRTAELVNEAQATLEYTTIRAPGSGVVVDKKVSAGDMVMPGQTIATLYDPTHMQLNASVREMLTQRLKVGQDIGVRMDALNRTCGGTISEIVPEAESASRTFLVKVTGPCPPGIYSGMFGRIIIPLDAQQVLLVPAAALSRVGQLDMVEVVGHDNRLERRTVQLGRKIDSDMEILSGLTEGEKVAVRSVATSTPSTQRAPGGGHE